MTTVEKPTRREQSGTSRVRADVRLRDEPTGGGRRRGPLSVSALVERGRRLASCAPYTDRPPSLEQVVAYVRAGGFVPGEQPWWVEAPGYVYGALVAVPATAVGYALMWTVQRPTRLLCVLYVLALIAAAWFAPSLLGALLLAPLAPLATYGLVSTKTNKASTAGARR